MKVNNILICSMPMIGRGWAPHDTVVTSLDTSDVMTTTLDTVADPWQHHRRREAA